MFSKASLEFLPALLLLRAECVFCKWISSSEIWAFLVLDCGLCTCHPDSFLCVEVRACEGGSYPGENRRAHVLLVAINAVLSILSSLFFQEKYPSSISHQLSE